MKTIHRCMAASLVALLVTGCVTTRSASIRPEGSTELVELHRTTTGLIMGPCVPAPGRVEEPYWLRLRGTGPVYDVSGIEFLDRNGVPWSDTSGFQGQVTIESGRRRVVVALTRKGQAMHMNGTYPIQDVR